MTRELDLNDAILSLKLFLSVMPKKTTDELFKNVLTELEQLAQQLDLQSNDSDTPVTGVATGNPLTHPCKKTLLATDKRQPPESFTDE